MLVSGLACAAAQPAYAQGGADLSIVPAPAPALNSPGLAQQIYTPDYFTAFAPRNALDMLQQVPGFVIVAQAEARGLGEASGNVLINNRRLPGKTDSAQDQLARIPASNVERIEIVDGTTLDIPGLSGRVANIIVSSGAISGQFQWDPQFRTRYGKGALLGGKVSISGRAGPVDYTLALTSDPYRGGTAGPTYVTDAAGQPIEYRAGRTEMRTDDPKISGTFKFDGPGSSVGNLNLAYMWDRYRNNETYDSFTADDAPLSRQSIESREKERYYEIGGDFEFPLGPGRLKLIGLERFEHTNYVTQSTTAYTDGSDPQGDRYALLADWGERIARAEYRWRMLGGDWQFSGEAAFNRLDNVATLFELDPSGAFTEVPFPEGTGGVTEDRYEAMVSYNRPLTGNLTLQLGIGGEYSTIAQTGSNAERRSFKRPKGSLLLSWQPRNGLDVSLELRRAVGQLEFGDFLASVDFEDDNSNAGNNQLVPPQSWEAQLDIAKDFGRWGSATLTLFENRIQDPVTIIPLNGGLEGVGNLDRATKRGLAFTGTLKFDPLGIPGAKIDAKMELDYSRIIDPVSGRQRSFNYAEPIEVSANFRHDIPGSDFAWGFEITATKFLPYYRLAEIGYEFDFQHYGAVFVEHKDVFGLTVQAQAGNLLDGRYITRRTVYSGPRDSAPVLYQLDRNHKIGPSFTMQVKGNF